MNIEEGEWYGLQDIASKQYTCGYCGRDISSQKAYYAVNSSRVKIGKIYVCHHCNKPTYFTYEGRQTPGSVLGGNVEHLPADISALYNEIRQSTTTSSYTASVLAARKLLMHIAVALGAETGKKFVTYVNYLAENGYTPPNARVWVDQIRSLGNDANHEIIIMDESQANSVIKFIEMLLKYNYEFPAEAGVMTDNDENQ